MATWIQSDVRPPGQAPVPCRRSCLPLPPPLVTLWLVKADHEQKASSPPPPPSISPSSHRTNIPPLKPSMASTPEPQLITDVLIDGRARTSTAVCRICFISSCSSSGTAKRVLYGGIICFRSAGGHDPGTRQRQLDFYSSAAGQAAGDDPPPKQRSCGRAFS